MIHTRTFTAIAGTALLLLGACSDPPHNTVSDPSRSGSSYTPESRSGRPAAPASNHAALNWARARIGSPYQWGGTGATGFDCSGLVQVAFTRAGLNLPRTTQAQAQRGQKQAGEAWSAPESSQRLSSVRNQSCHERLRGQPGSGGS